MTSVIWLTALAMSMCQQSATSSTITSFMRWSNKLKSLSKVYYAQFFRPTINNRKSKRPNLFRRNLAEACRSKHSQSSPRDCYPSRWSDSVVTINPCPFRPSSPQKAGLHSLYPCMTALWAPKVHLRCHLRAPVVFRALRRKTVRTFLPVRLLSTHASMKTWRRSVNHAKT